MANSFLNIYSHIYNFKMKSLIRLAHLLSSAYVVSVIILSLSLDLKQYDFYTSDSFKKLNHICGLIMIFSGILLIYSMKRKYASPEEKVWISFFPIKFIMSISVTPFTVRVLFSNEPIGSYYKESFVGF